MDISLIICSYNRAHNLDACFKHLLAQKNSADIAWELILVDNNSSDNTRTVVEKYANESALNIRYSFEAQQGLSFARNHGIALAEGTWVAFIDDDIRVSEVWLKTLHDTFQQYDCDAVGGRIHIESPQSLPQWISPDMYGFLGHQDFGTQAHPMDGYNEFPFGGNMAVHRRVFDNIGVFNTQLGRRGEGNKSDELFKGEETDFFHRLADTGGHFRYHPDLLVLHKILPYQLEKKFFLTLHKNAGILKAQQDTRLHKRSIMGIPLFVYPQFLRSIGHYVRQIFSNGKNSAFRKRMNIAYFTGMMQAYRSASKQS